MVAQESNPADRDCCNAISTAIAPARSPVPSPCDFCGGISKQRVKHRLGTSKQLKGTNIEEIVGIPSRYAGEICRKLHKTAENVHWS